MHFAKEKSGGAASAVTAAGIRGVFSLLPRTKLTRTHTIRCDHRGEFLFGAATVTTGDLMGLVNDKTIHVPCANRLVVYPKLLPQSEIKSLYHSWQGDVTVRRFILDDPFLIAGTREYRPGDPLSQINWKATAHAGTLQVRQRDFTANPQLLILFNMAADSGQWGLPSERQAGVLEYGLRVAATLAEMATESGLSVGFATNGAFPNRISTEGGLARALEMTEGKRRAEREPIVYHEPVSGRGSEYELFETMAMLTYRQVASLSTVVEELEEKGALEDTDVVIVSAYEDDNIRDIVAKMRRSTDSVEVLCYGAQVPQEPAETESEAAV